MSDNWYLYIPAEGGDAWKTTFRSTRHDFFGVNLLDFFSGESMPNWDNRSWLGADKAEFDGTPFDALCDHLGIPVISERMSTSLLEHVLKPGEVEFLPVRLIRPNNREILGYRIMNILHSVPALDLERSKFVSYNPAYIDPATNRPHVAVGRPAIRGDLLKSRSIVRIPDVQMSIFVSQCFVDVYRQNRFTGCTFTKVMVV